MDLTDHMRQRFRVEVNPAVIVPEEIRIPERERSPDLFVRPVQDILRPILIAGVLAVRRRKIYKAFDNTHIRGVIIERQFFRKSVILPVQQIIRYPDAKRHRRKYVIAAFK